MYTVQTTCIDLSSDSLRFTRRSLYEARDLVDVLNHVVYKDRFSAFYVTERGSWEAIDVANLLEKGTQVRIKAGVGFFGNCEAVVIDAFTVEGKIWYELVVNDGKGGERDRAAYRETEIEQR